MMAVRQAVKQLLAACRPVEGRLEGINWHTPLPGGYEISAIHLEKCLETHREYTRVVRRKARAAMGSYTYVATSCW